MEEVTRVDVCCPICLRSLEEGYVCHDCSWRPITSDYVPFRMDGSLAYTEEGRMALVKILPERREDDDFYVAYSEANEEHKKVDALRSDVRRLRNILRLCVPILENCADIGARDALCDAIQDELAKE